MWPSCQNVSLEAITETTKNNNNKKTSCFSAASLLLLPDFRNSDFAGLKTRYLKNKCRFRRNFNEYVFFANTFTQM